MKLTHIENMPTDIDDAFIAKIITLLVRARDDIYREDTKGFSIEFLKQIQDECREKINGIIRDLNKKIV